MAFPLINQSTPQFEVSEVSSEDLISIREELIPFEMCIRRWPPGFMSCFLAKHHIRTIAYSRTKPPIWWWWWLDFLLLCPATASAGCHTRKYERVKWIGWTVYWCRAGCCCPRVPVGNGEFPVLLRALFTPHQVFLVKFDVTDNVLINCKLKFMQHFHVIDPPRVFARLK